MPVGSKPRALFRLAIGHPEALIEEAEVRGKVRNFIGIYASYICLTFYERGTFPWNAQIRHSQGWDTLKKKKKYMI